MGFAHGPAVAYLDHAVRSIPGVSRTFHGLPLVEHLDASFQPIGTRGGGKSSKDRSRRVYAR